MTKNSFACTVCQKLADPLGRYIILKAVIKEASYVLINLYAPNKDKEIINFLKTLLIILRNENLDSEENIIIGGNFNCPLNPLVDKRGGILNQRKSATACIDCLQTELDLVDIWRIKQSRDKEFHMESKIP